MTQEQVTVILSAFEKLRHDIEKSFEQAELTIKNIEHE